MCGDLAECTTSGVHSVSKTVFWIKSFRELVAFNHEIMVTVPTNGNKELYMTSDFGSWFQSGLTLRLRRYLRRGYSYLTFVRDIATSQAPFGNHSRIIG